MQATIANSAEAQSDLTALYRTELGRTLNAGGLAYFTQVLASGGTLSGVQATIANSAEAQSDLTALYRTELGRPLMPEELAYFTQVLASGGTLGVQATIANSAEAQSDLTALYRTELGRTPDAGGLAYFTQVLASGGTLSGVQATIANSTEAQGAGQTQLASGLSLTDLNTQTLMLNVSPQFIVAAGTQLQLRSAAKSLDSGLPRSGRPC